jgi:hypothetical protein
MDIFSLKYKLTNNNNFNMLAAYRAYLYGNDKVSSLLVEELPEPKLSVPPKLPGGCEGVPRNIYVVVRGDQQS